MSTTAESQNQPKRKTRFVNPNELHQVDLGDGDWVKIPTKMTTAISAQIARFNPKGGAEDGQKIAQFLSVVVKEWNLVDENGNVAPINEEWIGQLAIEDSMKIVSAVNEIIAVPDIPKVDKPRSDEQ